MVPRLDADALVDALALRVPAGRVPLRPTSSPRTRRRGTHDPEFELLDTGIFDDDRYWEITADYAKATPEDILVRVDRPQRRPGARRRSTCCRRSGSATRGRGASTTAGPSHPPRRRSASSPSTTSSGTRLLVGDGSAGARSSARTRRTPSASSGRRRRRPYPKDGIGDHVVHGAATVNPEQTGTKAAFRYRLEVAPGETRDDRAPPAATRPAARRRLRRRASTARRAEADEFYAELTPAGRAATRRCVLRQALAGMLWSKQFYHYDVQRWLDGDPAEPPPPRDAPHRPQRATGATSNNARRHLDARQVGVPVVRGVGPRVPLRRARPRRPGVRQGAAHPALPRVVHAPERPAARLRVGVRRRQPARARLGGAAGVRDRRRARTSTSSSASSTSCCSTSPGG